MKPVNLAIQDNLTILGPLVVRDNHRPTIVYSVFDSQIAGMRSCVPYVIVVKHDNAASFSWEGKSYVHQFVTLVSNADLNFNGCEIEFSYDYTTVIGFDGSVSEFEEEIEFSIGDSDSKSYGLECGRVFVLTVNGEAAKLQQLNANTDELLSIDPDDKNSVTELVYRWWDSVRSRK